MVETEEFYGRQMRLFACDECTYVCPGVSKVCSCKVSRGAIRHGLH